MRRPGALRPLPHARSALAAVVVLALLGACSPGGTSDDVRPGPEASTASSAGPSPAAGGYVALGDSFTAGPGIDPLRGDSGLCSRSARNWPTVLADSLDLPLTDLSCSGATTSDLASTVASSPALQDAALVTVSAGGNDGGLFLSLIQACASGGGQCGAFAGDRVPALLRTTTADLASLLAATAEAAPRARLVLVGYPRLMPSSGTCAEASVPAADVAAVAGAERALDGALRSAARTADVEYVSLRSASEGHDACAGDEAWTNGTSPAAGDGIVFHPDARGMAAVADVVASAVRG